MDAFIEFGKFMVTDMKKKNIDFLYGTCTRDTKAMHTLAGFKVIDKIEKKGRKIFLIKYNIKDEKEIL